MHSPTNPPSKEAPPPEVKSKGKMAVIECTTEWGASTIVRSSPCVARVRRVLYTPFAANQKWGLYNNGALIGESVDYRGIEKIVALRDTAPLQSAPVASELPKDVLYFYGGVAHLHYGHFLINTLARFWPFARESWDRCKIVLHFPGSIEDLFSVGAIAALFGAMGLRKDSFIIPTEPVLIPDVLIPSSSFGEQTYAHEAYRDLTRVLGDSLRRRVPNLDGQTPVYLTKEFLKIGVGRIVNETELVAILKRANINIIAPENLSFVEQLALFDSGAPIIGTATSAMHTTAFSERGARIICINPTLYINSNFTLIDKLVKNDAQYLYDEGTTIVEDPSFITGRKLENPKEVAERVIEMVRTSG